MSFCGALPKTILDKYHVLPNAKLGSGMEADVYAYGDKKVLRIYQDGTSVDRIAVLKEFYDGLEDGAISYALPQIYAYAEEGPYTVTIEKRLFGTPMTSVIYGADNTQLPDIMDIYLSALLELRNIEIPQSYERYKLYDNPRISSRSSGDWHSFLSRYLDQQSAQIRDFLNRDVIGFTEKLERLQSTLAQPYTGEVALVHGDFFPGNLLVDADLHVTALLDFGLFTMYGDPLFDLATSWVFFDMYDELKRNLRESLLSLIRERFGDSIMGKLYLYVLLYSIFSANTYSPQCEDGHYLWCVANLNNERYWRGLET